MKFLIVVLAIAKCVLAAPEADPQLLLNAPSLVHPALAHPSPLLAAPLGGLTYAAASPLVHPQVYHAAPAIVAPVTTTVVKPAVGTYAHTPAGPLAVPAYHPHACVTPGGCAVRTLKNLGLARKRRESDPEAEADPQFIAPASTLPLALSPYALNPYLNAYPYGLNAYNNLYGYAPAHPYAYAAPALTAAQIAAPAPIAAAPIAAAPIAAAPIAAPVPTVVKHVVKPAPIVKPVVVKAAPIVHHIVKPAVVKPVVAHKTVPVTYTHLGAHPISPTTVLETRSKVIGHTLH